MSVLSNVFSTRFKDIWTDVENEEYVSQRDQKLSHLGYDPQTVKSYREKMNDVRSDDERILLGAQLAHSRSSGRQRGRPVTIEYKPWQDDGYDYPARGALAWLKENGEKHGVTLHPTK